MDGELAVKQGCCSSPSVDAGPAPSDVKGFTNAAVAWTPKSGHGADGRLANHHGSPFWH
ncbi:hypothetical protein [Shewanella putrefaciens]|uniref:hypothetical protein n=1 Tax=Shewanella putrefaciens TaxID=24 RepID=UPI003566BCC1